MDQFQSIQPLMPVMTLPTLPIFPLQQRQTLGPISPISPVLPLCDDEDSINIVNISTTPTFNIPVVITSTSPFNALLTDLYIGVNNTSTSPFSVILPANPPLGKLYIIKDFAGNAQTYPISISATGSNIDTVSVATINVNFGSVTLVFNGADWSVV